MRKSLLILAGLMSLAYWSCNDEPEMPEAPLELLAEDAQALELISNYFDTYAEDYPVPWTYADSTTWREIKLDTVTDEESGTRYLTVGSITLYLTSPDKYIQYHIHMFKNLKELKVYGCAGSMFSSDNVPRGLERLLIDRLDPDEPGYIMIPKQKFDVSRRVCTFKEVTIHGTDMKYVDFFARLDGYFDLSHNLIEDKVSTNMTRFFNPFNLSHNKYKVMENGWSFWKTENNIPNLQYNELEIPQDIIESDFWKKHSEKFIGNPGYVAPQ